MIAFSLPAPPSTNALFSTIPTLNGTKRVKTKVYRAWLSEAGWQVPPAARGKILGHFKLALTFDRINAGRRVDLDNRIKAVADLLTAMRVITDDSLNEGMTVDWSSPFTAPVFPTHPMVRVTVTPAHEEE
jgi:Holliday junction resolvase RusA-like endonuclease